MTSNIQDIISLFFHDLKQYNSTNFRTIKVSDLNKEDATIFKSFSSVVTRYFIFRERHTEISDADMRILYFKLRIDMIARYFSEYPASNVDDLRPFQSELHRYIAREKGSEDVDPVPFEIQDKQFSTTTTM